jgi:ABC-type antimicrobial peptide transport system ATPase subunit
VEELRSRLGAEPDDIAHPPPGCRFHLRCPFGPAWLDCRDVCRTTHPTLGQARVACHFPLSAAAPGARVSEPVEDDAVPAAASDKKG